MKNHNPLTGLRQISSGYVALPRKFLIEIIRSKSLSPLEVGYLVISIISADWDTDPYRYGIIRHPISRLSKILNISYGTIHGQIKKLTKKGFLSKENDTLKINNFTIFTSKGAQQYVRDSKPTNEDLKQIFKNILLDIEISTTDQTEKPRSFRDSSKGKSTFGKDDREWINKEYITRVNIDDES